MATKKTGRLAILVGGQLGSEGKGVVAAHIANEYDYHVRVGGPNAGHSFRYGEDATFAMQGVPCGWVNRTATLCIGAGGIVDPKLIQRELYDVSEYDHTIYGRLLIDPQATVLDERAHDAEGGVEGEMHARIGSTGEGVGAARHARMSRDPERCTLAKDVPALSRFISVEPISEVLHSALTRGKNVLIEGTQGSGLSLVHGPWPYTTSADTNSAQMLADVGLPPAWVDEIIMVARTFPIRVAGNSGPLENEVDWDYISKRLGRETVERTTVTKKVRRIGEWDEALFLSAVHKNAPTQIALTFVDYLDAADEAVDKFDNLTPGSRAFIRNVEESAGCPVAFVGTGGKQWTLIDRR